MKKKILILLSVILSTAFTLKPMEVFKDILQDRNAKTVVFLGSSYLCVAGISKIIDNLKSGTQKTLSNRNAKAITIHANNGSIYVPISTIESYKTVQMNTNNGKIIVAGPNIRDLIKGIFYTGMGLTGYAGLLWANHK